MKNRIIRVLLLLSATALISIPCVASNRRQEDIIETDVAAQEETSTITKETEIIEEPKIYNTGYCTSNADIYASPDTNSEVIDTYVFNDEIQYSNYNEQFVEVIYEDNVAYIPIDYINENKYKHTEYQIPSYAGFKSYMSYKTITCKSSTQYKLQKQYAYTGVYGIRMVDDRYCIAIGTAFDAEIGDYIDLVLQNGEVIRCIVADIKNPRHTDVSNVFTIVGKNRNTICCTEFIVDIRKLDSDAKTSGNISTCYEEWDSPVVAMRIYNKNIFKGE